jgi:tripeptide aminopeptidase
VNALHVEPASAAERERLLADFVRLCEIPSPSWHERAVADAVTADLRELGLDVHEDERSKVETGSEAGNLLARIPGPEGGRTVLLGAHLDTVPLDAPVEVQVDNGLIHNRNDAILGADNKAAIATILGTARRLVRTGSPVEVELLFTVCEEPGLIGAKAIEVGELRSEFGFMFDHASPIGELIGASPSYYRVGLGFRGQAAHAGIEPERGRNAIVAAAHAIGRMPLGRLDDQTTANVGKIEGGTARNVVAERCTVELETRSLDDARAADVVRRMVDAATEAASDAEVDVETSVARICQGYRLPRSAPVVEAAARALTACGIEHRHVASGGGSDANILNAAGLPVVNVANGTQNAHQPDECVTVEALETMLDVTIALVAASAPIASDATAHAPAEPSASAEPPPSRPASGEPSATEEGPRQ